MIERRVAIFAERGYFTAVHNLTFRVVMPRLSSSAWKVLCFLISETVGYNRESELISYAAMMKGTGLGSAGTVSRALAELLAGEAFGCPLILREMGERCGATSHESARYGLNLQFTVTLPKSKCESPKKRGAKNGASGSAKSEARLISDKESDESLSSEAESPHFLALCAVCELDVGLISEKRRCQVREKAELLAARYTPEEIRLAGSRWPLPVAPHLEQFLDSIQALLNKKEKHERPQRGQRGTAAGERQRSQAAERRELMAELAERFG